MSAVRNSSRTSTILNRPQFAPAGPRIRCSSLITSSPPMDSPILPRDSTLSFGVMNSSTTLKPLPSHPNPLPAPSFPYPESATSPILDPRSDADDGSWASDALAALLTSSPSSVAFSEQSSLATSLPSVNEEEPTSAPAYHYNPPDVRTGASPASPSFPSPARVTALSQILPKLTPPSPISFESVAVPWKAMPLEPALWTFNSKELQDIVSRAIRLSAKESFLRLLTIENLDKVLPAELERLAQLKKTTQARYRFLVQRRTMLFQALNSSSIRPRKGEECEVLVGKLTAQLVETITDCDQRLEELFRINDQTAQINKLLDVHASSALAVALRKLNSSYARRTRDLNKARQRIFQLEAEIEDAWNEAEKLADELDEYEASGADDALIEVAEVVPVPVSPSQSQPPLPNVDRRGSVPMPMTPTLLAVKTISPLLPTFAISRPQTSSSASPMSTHFVLSPPLPTDQPNDDAVSIKSSKSVKSTKSAKSVKSTKSAKAYASSLLAAKKRSSRVSHSSLRLSVSSSSHHGPSENLPPPIPEIPLHFVNAVYGSGPKSGEISGNQSPISSSTALHYVTSSRLERSSNGSYQFRRVKKQASLDTIPSKKRGSATIDAYRGKAADDIYIMTGESSHGHHSALQSSRSPYSSVNANVNLSWDDDSEIQAVPRTPPHPNISTDSLASDHIKDSDLPPLPPPKDPMQSPSSPQWKSQMPATPNLSLPSLPKLPHSVPSPPNSAARRSTGKPGLLRRSKTLVMIRGFTKRYSAAIPPIFNGKPSVKKTG